MCWSGNEVMAAKDGMMRTILTKMMSEHAKMRRNCGRDCWGAVAGSSVEGSALHVLVADADVISSLKQMSLGGVYKRVDWPVQFVCRRSVQCFESHYGFRFFILSVFFKRQHVSSLSDSPKWRPQLSGFMPSETRHEASYKTFAGRKEKKWDEMNKLQMRKGGQLQLKKRRK